jgi:hypothetical protein
LVALSICAFIDRPVMNDTAPETRSSNTRLPTPMNCRLERFQLAIVVLSRTAQIRAGAGTRPGVHHHPIGGPRWSLK